MARKITRVAAAAAMVGATFLMPTHAAQASDGCGSGWYKESDGYLTKENFWDGPGARNAWTYHSGRVRFCTDNDTFNDDENRRALIGYPSDSYPFESWVIKNGSYAKFCVKQTVRAHMTGIKSSDSWSIGGNVSKGDAGVNASYSATYDTLTVSVGKTATCAGNADQINRVSGITLTASDESGEIQWVELTTKLTMTYWVNGTKHTVSHSVTERDNS